MPLYRHKHTGALVLATAFLGVLSDEIRQLLGAEGKDWRHQPDLGSIDLGVGTREEGDAQTEAETLRQHDILVRDPEAGTAVALSPQEFAESYDSAAQHPDEPLTQAEYLKDHPLPEPGTGGTVTVTPSDDDDDDDDEPGSNGDEKPEAAQAAAQPGESAAATAGTAPGGTDAASGTSQV